MRKFFENEMICVMLLSSYLALANIINLPILSRSLSINEFGSYSTLLLYGNIVSVLLLFGAPSGLMRFGNESSDVLSSSLLFMFIVAICLLSIFLILSQLFGLIDILSDNGYFLIFAQLFSYLIQAILVILRLKVKFKFISLFCIFHSSFLILTVHFLAPFLLVSLSYLYIGLLIVNVVSTLGLVLFICKSKALRFPGRNIFLNIIKFGILSVGANIIISSINFIQRLCIAYFVSDTQVGLYAYAAFIASGIELGVFTVTAQLWARRRLSPGCQMRSYKNKFFLMNILIFLILLIVWDEIFFIIEIFVKFDHGETIKIISLLLVLSALIRSSIVYFDQKIFITGRAIGYVTSALLALALYSASVVTWRYLGLSFKLEYFVIFEILSMLTLFLAVRYKGKMV